jgi:hypothetical protein
MRRVGPAAAIAAVLAACGAPGAGIAGPTPAPSVSAAPSAVPTAPAHRVGPAALEPVPTGQRPPQIVVVAFDGSGVAVEGKYPMFDFWRQMSRDHDARFTFFLSGPYLLTSQTQNTYLAPQLGPAHPGLGMEVNSVIPLPGQSENDAVRYEMNNLRGANAEGNEIGTHFNGHICGGGRGSVGTFSQADWEQEIQAFDKMVDEANQTNHLDPPVDLGFTSKDIVGSRTPCLEGNFRTLYPVLAKHGYRYDTSPTPDTTWPRRGAGDTGPSNLWVFPLAFEPFYGTRHHVLSMDYNICFLHDGCKTSAAYQPGAVDTWRQQALDTYRSYFESSYTGDRSPIYLGNHFEMWHDGAYTEALAAFVTETCAKPEVRCVSYRDLADWLDTVPVDQLESWRHAAFGRYVDPNPPAYGKPVADAPVPHAVSAKP